MNTLFLAMTGYYSILIILIAELLIFVTEILLASVYRKNKVLRENSPLENKKIINLENGFRTNISFFRLSLFVVYIILIVLFFNIKSKYLAEEIILYTLGGVLIYMVSFMSSKIFMFYESFFIISSPFNIFRKDQIIHYSSINEFYIYRALYNSFYLKLVTEDSQIRYIHFAGSYLPKNDLALQSILREKTKFKEEVIQEEFP